jgi:hypothetical protein
MQTAGKGGVKRQLQEQFGVNFLQTIFIFMQESEVLYR